MATRLLTGAVAALGVSVFVLGASSAAGQCTKDTDCKGNRICVNGACVDPGPSVNAAEPSAPQNTEPPTRPTEAEVKVCVAKLEDLGRMYGTVIRVEYGATMLSQGGMTEMELGAPKGTSIHPVRLRFHDYRTGEAWIYRDSFGTLKCARHGNVDYSPPTTPEERAAAINDGETIRVPIKIINGYAPNQSFAAGTLAISKSSLSLNAPGTNLGFSSTMDKVFPVGTQNWQLHLRLLLIDQLRREYNQDVYLWDPAVQFGPGGRSVDCSRCGNSMSELLSLLQLARKSSN
jgi:hypothetical protein